MGNAVCIYASNWCVLGKSSKGIDCKKWMESVYSGAAELANPRCTSPQIEFRPASLQIFRFLYWIPKFEIQIKHFSMIYGET